MASQISFLNVHLSSCPAARNLLQVEAEAVSEVCVMYGKTGFKKETKNPPKTSNRVKSTE